MESGFASASQNARDVSRIVREALEECWKKWQTLPARVRYSVYAGALLGIAFYPILGFCSAGVLKGSIAAAIQSSMGNVAAGSLFATMQSLGAKGVLMLLIPLGGMAITPVVVEIIVWIHGRLLQLLKWLSSSFDVPIPTEVTENIEKIQDFIRSKAKQTKHRSTLFPLLTV